MSESCTLCVCVPSALGWSLLLSGLVTTPPHSSRLSLSLSSVSLWLCPQPEGLSLIILGCSIEKKSSPFHIQVFHSCILVLLSHFMPGTVEHFYQAVINFLFFIYFYNMLLNQLSMHDPNHSRRILTKLWPSHHTVYKWFLWIYSKT